MPSIASQGRFDGHVAMVTGGAAGFGAAFATALAAEGCGVALADVDVAGAEEVAARINDAGGRAMAVACDVADEDAADAAAAAASDALGDVSILINNAGLHLTKYNQPFSVLPRSDVRRLLDVNVIGVINCSMACRGAMARRGGGSIVNISSIAGYLASSPYGVSKLAVRGLTVALASELGGDGIRVNAVAPGLMATDNALADLPAALVEDFVTNRQVIHRTGQVADVVAAVLWLCSPEAAFVTGETVRVSGGYPMGV